MLPIQSNPTPSTIVDQQETSAEIRQPDDPAPSGLPASEELLLLRRFEPVLRSTHGERFFPCDVERYISECSLWVQPLNQPARCVVPEGELDLEKLASSYTHGFGAIYYLRFIEPLNIAELAVYRIKQTLNKKLRAQAFHAGRGRLGRVGYVSRFVDALFSLSLLARGRVTGDAAFSAVLTYEKLQAPQAQYTYYGRVLRQNGWIILQYWYFYPFNNWRSGFYGVNDHEADWEMATIYLYENGGEVKPEWVAYAAHDFSGDDLRRRWDDPEVEKVGEHPVIYVGAGSHASYFTAGEYLAEVALPFVRPVLQMARYAQGVWRGIARQVFGATTGGTDWSASSILRVPFVDYARGDGVSIGSEQDKAWNEAVLIDDETPWVRNFRGLWGLFAQDPVAGEDAPAGPRYNRDGSPRASWMDPLAWAGLTKVPPPDRALAAAVERRRSLAAELQAAHLVLAEKQAELQTLGLQAQALLTGDHLGNIYARHQEQIARGTSEINEMLSRIAETQVVIEALDRHIELLRRGEREPVRAHIRRAHHPEPPQQQRVAFLAELWAALSIGIVMLGFVGLVLFARQALVLGLAAMIGLMILFEAGFRRRLDALIHSATVALAIAAALVIFYEFFWEIVVLLVLIAGVYILWENLRELWD